MSDRYPRFLPEELLPEVEAKYNVRKDAYFRGITGLSSGAMCGFNAGWQMPEGGQDDPGKILRGPKRNLPVWFEDGSRDMHGPAQLKYGSWISGSLGMANALKRAGYGFHFSFGEVLTLVGKEQSNFPKDNLAVARLRPIEKRTNL